MSRAGLWRFVGAGLCIAVFGSTANGQEGLQPYQLVRSLQLVQDRIASGDHAALPMQGKLLEITDQRLRSANAQDFKEARNFRALMVYGMSGGNPATLEVATSRLELSKQDKAIAGGVIAYLQGDPGGALQALRSVDPMLLPRDLGTFVALIKGSLLAREDPKNALILLDQARLLSPGTLVEEAALRRSVAIAATTGDAARFARASTQYVGRYLRSPYASQFADAFVAGVVSLNMAISHEKLDDITAMMDPEREKVIYLRIARSAAIEGLIDLSTFASARAEQGHNGIRNIDDPRALLYASLSTVTSETIEDVREKLGKIDRNRLSESDRFLLDAARAITSEVVAPPAKAPSPVTPQSVETSAGAKAAAKPQAEAEAAIPATDAAGSELPLVEGIMPEQPASLPSEPSTAVAEAPVTSDAPKAVPSVAKIDPTDEAIANTHRTLDKIDQLLGAAPE
jgi:chemotaxis protein MotC